MSAEHNATFNYDVYASISESTRVSNNEHAFISQYVGSQAEPIAVMPNELGERDNDIYNMGVHDGAAGLLDSLHRRGYQILDPNGTRVEPAQESSFSKDYFSTRYWDEVSN